MEEREQDPSIPCTGMATPPRSHTGSGSVSRLHVLWRVWGLSTVRAALRLHIQEIGHNCAKKGRVAPVMSLGQRAFNWGGGVDTALWLDPPLPQKELK